MSGWLESGQQMLKNIAAHWAAKGQNLNLAIAT